MISMSHTMAWTMKVSRNGQVSIPAEVRARWGEVERVTIVDLGDHIAMRPTPDDPVKALRGKYRGRGRSTDEMRAMARAEDEARERRRYG